MAPLNPLVVHIAGTPDADGLQRCLSCATPLQDNRAYLEGRAMIPDGQEDNGPHWWPGGALIATDKIIGSPVASITYTVEGRPLDHDEQMCSVPDDAAGMVPLKCAAPGCLVSALVNPNAEADLVGLLEALGWRRTGAGDWLCPGPIGGAAHGTERDEMITAKVKCSSKGEPTGDGQVALSFLADYGDGRNKEWSLYTPSLSLSMTVKGDVANLFEQGKAYTLQFVEDATP